MIDPLPPSSEPQQTSSAGRRSAGPSSSPAAVPAGTSCPRSPSPKSCDANGRSWSRCSSAPNAGSRRRCFPQRSFRYHLLPVEPIYRRQWWKNIRWPLIALNLRRELDQAVRHRATGRRHRDRRLCLGSLRLVRGTARNSHRHSRTERIPGNRHSAVEPEGPSRLPGSTGSAGQAEAGTGNPGLRHRQSHHSTRSLPPGSRRGSTRRGRRKAGLAC